MYEHNGGDVLLTNINGVISNGTNARHHSGGQVVTESHPRDVEMYRLIGQFLCDRGLNGTYAQLSKESGIPLEHTDATDLRHATLEGRWDDAEAAVDRLTPLVGDKDTVEEVRFILLEQRFLECLEANEIMPAVTLLRNRITPMQRNTDRVHTLASCLMCRTLVELSAQAGGWPGKDGGSRLQLINRIQALVPAHAMLPPHRLEELIEDSVRSQLNSCLFHNPSIDSNVDLNSVSLLQRHSCGTQNFPAYCIQNLQQRDGELWHCQFSPDGSYLAVAGKEANVDMLKVDGARHLISRFRTLETPAHVACLCWSPDSKKLATCCREEQSTVCVFDVTSGQLLCSQKVNEEDTYAAATFFADSRKLAFGGLKGVFYIMDTEDQGRILTSVEGYRVQSMAAILPPLPHIGHESPHADERRVDGPSDLTAPGGPDSLPLMDANGFPLIGLDGGGVDRILQPAVDQLLVADSLHRIRLFRFGHLGSTSNSQQQAPDASVAPEHRSAAAETGEDEPAPTSSTPADLTVYLSGTAPGAPGSAIAVSQTTAAPGLDNPTSVSAMYAATRLLRQQRRMLQSTLSGSTTGTTTSAEQSLWNTPHASVQTGTVPPAFLFDMPILPVGSRLGGSSSPSQSQLSALRPILQHHQHPSGTSLPSTTPSYAVVSSSSSGVAGGGSANSLTIVFGTPVDRSVSTVSTGTITSTSAELRALTAAATALASSHSTTPFPTGLVRSLSTMVTTGSSPVDSSTAGGGRSAAIPASTTSLTPTGGAATTGAVDAASASATETNAGSGYGLLDHRTLFKETHGIQSIIMSRSGQRALVTIQKMGLHLWDVESCSIIQRFIGYKQDTFKILPAFGGADDHFVASGSENGLIHIWSANSGNHPIHSMRSPLSGPNHDAVTCVHWNPMWPTMLASVNDVGELTIWGPQRFTLNTVQPMEEST